MSYTGSVHIDGIKPVTFIYAGSATIDTPYLAQKLVLSTANAVDVADQSEEIFGIAQEQNPIRVGEHLAIKTQGFTLALVGETLKIGDKIRAGIEGVVTLANAGDRAFGVCLSNVDEYEYAEIYLFGFGITI